MTARVVALCVHAVDPAPVARFWAAALRWRPEATAGEDVTVVPTDGTPFPVVVRRAPEPKVAKNPVHVDLTTSSMEDQAATVEQLLALGGRHVDVGQGADEPHVVLADPAGNELCIIEPGNRFLAGCGRLGSVTCDGSPRTGRFWSAALGWPLVWDQDDETAVRDPSGTGPFITWGPPSPAGAPTRLHLDLAPLDGDVGGEVQRLVSLGATVLDRAAAGGHGVLLADPDCTELCVVGR